ncbi:MAG: helix-turn-helix domain-containing protein [Victivallaceae bacterium]|nr:helix-turn-helix domain-containing protein [Victivallaceae bacterium]
MPENDTNELPLDFEPDKMCVTVAAPEPAQPDAAITPDCTATGEAPQQAPSPLPESSAETSGTVQEEKQELPYAVIAEAEVAPNNSAAPSPAAAESLASGMYLRLTPVELELPFGALLKLLRNRNQLEVTEVQKKTHIPRRYLDWLEAEEYTLLPPPAYVLAYVKMLCVLYHASPEAEAKLTETFRSELKCELPDEISKVVVDYVPSEENRRKLHRIVLFLGVGAAILVIVLTAAAMLLTRSGTSAAEPPVRNSSAFNAAQLYELLPQETLEIPEVPLPAER